MITLSRYKAGEVIVQENDFGETAYIIGEGRVEVSKELGGQSVHLAYLGVGETFGEMSMIDEKPRSATVTAVTETVVSEIRRDDFFDSFQTDPKVALTLLKVLFERLREADARILELQKAEIAPISRTGKLSNSHRPFIVNRTEVIKRLMSSLTIVKDFDVFKDSRPCFLPSFERAVIDHLVLQ
jgi:CRP-like cAMP-binding protein